MHVLCTEQCTSVVALLFIWSRPISGYLLFSFESKIIPRVGEAGEKMERVSIIRPPRCTPVFYTVQSILVCALRFSMEETRIAPILIQAKLNDRILKFLKK